MVVLQGLGHPGQLGPDVAAGLVVIGGGEQETLDQDALGEQTLGAADGGNGGQAVDGGQDMAENGVGQYGQGGHQGQGGDIAQGE